ncbi:MAG: DUF4340 domain-containing protein [Phycisphaeraceae bacterium]|nr:DUF4340 domain-containing protein [Phycisphaeraceae bacterium]
MNYKTTLFLLVLLVMAGAVLWVVRQNTNAPPGAAESAGVEEGRPLFMADELSVETIQGVEIESADGAKATVARQAEVWRQVEPVRFDLDNWSVTDLLDSVGSLRWDERFLPGKPGATPGAAAPTLEEVGLGTPRVRLTLQGERDGKAYTRTLSLGKRLGGRAYVQRDGDKRVYLVDDVLAHKLTGEGVASLRKRSLDAPGESQAQRIVLHDGQETIELVKGQGQWSFAPPLSGRVSRDAVRQLLTGISNIYIKSFTSDARKDLSPFGLDEPSAELAVTFAAPEDDQAKPAGTEPSPTQPSEMPTRMVTLRVGGATELGGEDRYATWTSDDQGGRVVFTLAGHDASKLDVGADTLRDPRLSPVDPTSVWQVQIQREDGPTLKLERGIAGWTLLEPKVDYALDAASVSDFVGALAQIKAEHYQTQDLPTDAQPVAIVTLGAAGQSRPETLRFYPRKAADADKTPSLLAVRNDETVGYIVPASAADLLKTTPLSLRDRTVLNLPAGELASLRIELPDGRAYQLTQAEPAAAGPGDESTTRPAAWSLTGESGLEDDALRKILKGLSPLHAQAWEDGSAAGRGGLIRLQLTMRSGEEHALSIEPATGRARLGDFMAAFDVSMDWVNALQAELRPRTVVPVRIEQVASVTVRDGDKAVELHRDNDGHYSAADGQAIDQAAAGALFDRLAGLRVERYLAVPPQGKKAAPQRTLSITTQDGATIDLAIVAVGESRYLTINRDRWAVLDGAAMQDLTAKVTIDEASKTPDK